MALRRAGILVAGLTLLVRPALSQEPKLDVVVDPRVELLCAALTQSDWSPAMGTFFSAYAQAAQKAFFPHRAHPFIRDIDLLKRRPVSLGELIAIGASRTPPPELGVSFALPGDVIRRLGGEKAFDKLIADLRNFSQTSDFPGFFERNKPLYESLTIAYRSLLPGESAERALEHYYGTLRQKYTIVLAPLLGRISYGWTDPGGGEPHSYLLVSPSRYADGKLVFEALDARDALFLGFGRLHASEALRNHLARLREHESWLPLLREKLQAFGMSDWPTAIKESVAAACAIRLFKAAGDSASATDLASKYEKGGFAWLPFLFDRLAEYEANRAKYPTLADFAPRLLDALDEIEPAYAGGGEPGDLGLADVWLTDAGVPVKKVAPGTMAAKAGIRAGDTVSAIAGIRINGSESYLKAWRRWEASKHGEKVPFKIVRNGKPLTLIVTMQRNLVFQGFRKKAGKPK